MGDEANQILTLVLVYGYPIIAITELLGSIGLPLPMTAIVLIAGSLAATGSLNIIILFILLTICSIAGDVLDYYLGRRFGYIAFQKLGKRSIVAKHSTEVIQRYFASWSGISIFLSRWLFTPFSSLVSILAGIALYSPKKFIAIAICGDMISTALLLGLGYIFGTNWPYIWDYVNGVPGILAGAVIGVLFIVIGIKKLAV